jgi:imidazolonepropionase-like amidohydrolase
MLSSLLLSLALSVPSAGAPASASPKPTEIPAARETRSFRLYKFQQPIGLEESIRVPKPDGGIEIRTTFSFTDRRTTVPLASLLSLAADGAPVSLQIWGSTSRWTKVDDRVTASGGVITLDHGGRVTTEAAPERFFLAGGYAPVAVTEELWTYWRNHGRPASIALYPLGGAAEISLRGSDVVTDDEGRQQTLERYSIRGLGWGSETLWVDGQGRVAALKAIDAEFDHFEATGRGYSDVLGELVASAAADGLAALKEMAGGEPAAADMPTAYLGATIVDATGAPPIRDGVVLVSAGRIAAVGSRTSVTIPENARRIDLAGKTVLPGLWDMHAHFQQVEWGPLYLAAGVTTVRDCGNELDFVAAARDAIAAGRGLGPRILLACIVDGEAPGSIGTFRLREPGEIPALIEQWKAAGCAQVKIYSSLDPKWIRPLAEAAHAAGLSVTGHIPQGIGAVAAVEAGYDQINHLSFLVRALLPPAYDPAKRLTPAEFARALSELDLESPAARQTLDFLKQRNVVVDPTMALGEIGTHTRAEIVAVEPGLQKVAAPLRVALDGLGVPVSDAPRTHAVWRANVAVLGALHRAGIPIVAGTDQAIPGHSLHRELELYVAAGFTPLEAIQAATVVPARAMGLANELGTIEAGKRADLIVVDGDPLADIGALRRISTVITGGRAYDTAPLWRLIGFEP